MEWIPLVDYAVKKGVSLSTLRRHIKANKVPHKVENGRYLLALESAVLESKQPGVEATAVITHLQEELQKAHEEIAELKTLIAYYEERMQRPRMDV